MTQILTHKAKEEDGSFDVLAIFFRRIHESVLFFDEHMDILNGIYITRFNGRPTDRETSAQAHDN
jgi:hypothetical protein